jgi:hypothetical protein
VDANEEDSDNRCLLSIRVTFPAWEGGTLVDIGRAIRSIGEAMEERDEQRVIEPGHGLRAILMSEDGSNAIPVKVVVSPLPDKIAERIARETAAVREMFGVTS